MKVSELHSKHPVIWKIFSLLCFFGFVDLDNLENGSYTYELQVHGLENFQVHSGSIGHTDEETDCKF